MLLCELSSKEIEQQVVDLTSTAVAVIVRGKDLAFLSLEVCKANSQFAVTEVDEGDRTCLGLQVCLPEEAIIQSDCGRLVDKLHAVDTGDLGCIQV